MLTRAMALPRRLLDRGAAGDAAAAGGRRIASNMVVQLAGRVFGMATSLVTVSLLARSLNPSDFGVFVAMTAYVGLFSVLTDLGFMITGTQRMAADPEREAEWLGALAGVRTTLAVATTVLCVASIPLFTDNSHNEHEVAFVLSAGILLAAPQALLGLFQARMRAGVGVVLASLQSVLWLGAVVVLAATGGSVEAFAAASIAVAAAVALLQVQLVRGSVSIAWRRGRALWGPLTRAAIPMGVASVLITVYYQVDSVLLEQIASPHEAGVYGAAYRFLAPLAFLPLAVMGSFLPVLSAIHGRDPARERRLVQTSADYMGVISLPVLATTIALSGPIVHLLYGAEYERSSTLLPVLMIAFVWICFGTLAGTLAPVLGLQWRLAAYAAVGAIANVALNIALIPSYGASGSAWATVATEGLTMALMLATALRRLGMRPAPWRLLKTAALAAAMTGVMALAAPLGLVPALLLGGAVYGAGLLAANIVRPEELRALRAAGG